MRTTIHHLFIAGLLALAAPLAGAADKVVFGTNWKAQAAHGGFYQAIADGTYAKAGLDVTIRPGGPQVNNRPLLPAGRIDFLMTGNLLHSFDNVKNGVPVVVVAAMFQKDPQALFSHPGAYRTFAELNTAPVAWIAKDAQFSWWAWLKAEHGFRDEQLRPYAYNLGPFLANKRSIQQGYAVEEPISIRSQGGFEPQTWLLADHGYSTYSTTIEARVETVQKNPALVKRFVEASIIGWVNYLHGDRSKADALIRRDNPDMPQATIDASAALMKQLGIVDSGDAQTLGIGAMRPERIADFHAKMLRAGLYKPGEVDLSKVATTAFVNQGVGVALARQLGAGR
ncbi:ABC transporter substrate-binding protein [Rivibacter subsaxonicus]|uniref:NitT/TauT family transport system substrate-binding protein n=1 Tax=Rivibacter subsaxonicus TaxID=457575 RepID=A0A4V2FU89_9BURK|nr:ABC transporter substrate-binding protein [Rivibacter subsaxonicus]RZU01136.1 NitT/TauT family transport system substrate-binding protein [Rivibacter subsaxonicus]